MRWKPLHGKPLVCVHWLDADASAPNEAFYEEDIKHKTTPMQTYGLIVSQNPDSIILMTEFYQEDDGKAVYRGRTTIPMSLVQNIEVLLEPVRPRKSRASTVSDSVAPV